MERDYDLKAWASSRRARHHRPMGRSGSGSVDAARQPAMLETTSGLQRIASAVSLATPSSGVAGIAAGIFGASGAQFAPTGTASLQP